jgi:alkanesulfonate monooxygenase SsuD/methylene tetrahydromethanopterin reductase-like flavin-dependent oxidoreductase (luciferase family)
VPGREHLSYGIAAACVAGGSHPGEVAVASEGAGFDVLFFPEHSHVPQGPALRRPAGPAVGRGYVDIFDSIVATAVALAVTRQLRVGPGVALLAQRDPLYFAKEVASLDVLSGGRVVVGVGAGWNAMELANHGVDYEDRLSLLESKLRLVLSILSGDGRAFAELVAPGVGAAGQVFGPRSIQQPTPPFLVGGESRASIELAARYGLRWMPSCVDPQRLIAKIRSVRDGDYGAAARALRITVYALPPEVGLLEQVARLDVDQVVFRIADAPGRRAVDEIQSVAGQLGRAA